MPSGVYVRTKKMRENMSKAKMGHKVSLETRRKISEARKGKHLSVKTRQLLSKIKMGHEVSEKTREKISNTLTGSNVLRGVKAQGTKKRKVKTGNWWSHMTRLLDRLCMDVVDPEKHAKDSKKDREIIYEYLSKLLKQKK